jgi:hypothetical protein
VLARPLQIGIYRYGQAPKGFLKPKLGIADPLNFSQSRQQLLLVNVVVEDGENSLPAGDGMSDFLLAHRGAKGVRADDEEEIVGSFDGGEDFRPPLGRLRNAAPVNPGVAIHLLKRDMEVADESPVLSRIRDEHLGHGRSGGRKGIRQILAFVMSVLRAIGDELR